MKRNILLCIVGICVGLVLGYVLLIPKQSPLIKPISQPLGEKQVIGFLPYWLLDNAKPNYQHTLSTLAYFSLNLDADGSIKKFSNPQENEPGWYTLNAGKADQFLTNALQNKSRLSLVVFSGDKDTISQIITDPVTSASHLANDIIPIMQKYSFSDLDLDIEYTQATTSASRDQFTVFVQLIKNYLAKIPKSSLTVAITPDDLVHTKLIDYKSIGEIADEMIIMGYDYHSPDSSVTGPNAPLAGGGDSSEYDVQTAVGIALQNIFANKLILGVPTYGYEWETLSSKPRAAVIPGTGVLASTRRVENYLAGCTNCTIDYDQQAQEAAFTYQDPQTGIFHQFFYPNKQSMTAKIDFIKQKALAGIAIWALGYEGETILDAVRAYRN